MRRSALFQLFLFFVEANPLQKDLADQSALALAQVSLQNLQVNLHIVIVLQFIAKDEFDSICALLEKDKVPLSRDWSHQLTGCFKADIQSLVENSKCSSWPWFGQVNLFRFSQHVYLLGRAHKRGGSNSVVSEAQKILVEESKFAGKCRRPSNSGVFEDSILFSLIYIIRSTCYHSSAEVRARSGHKYNFQHESNTNTLIGFPMFFACSLCQLD